MPNAPLPACEPERPAALQHYEILDTPPDAAFDRITGLAARLFQVPVALISLVDQERQWLKSVHGLGIRETDRASAFCAHAIASDAAVTVVEDARLDPRFVDCPLVAGPAGVRFYAGAPLRTADGLPLGTLCLMDVVPRTLDAGQQEALAHLAEMVTGEMDRRLAAQEAERLSEKLEQQNEYLLDSMSYLSALFEEIPVAGISVSEEGMIREWNHAAAELFGVEAHAALFQNVWDVLRGEDEARYAENMQQKWELLCRVFAGESFTGLEWAEQHRGGRMLYLQGNVFPLRRTDGRITGATCAMIDITERKEYQAQVEAQLAVIERANTELGRQRKELAEANAKLADLVTTDSLTGLKNRRFFYEALEKNFSFALRHGLPLSIVMLDVDRFKLYNDTHGHPAGDQVLRTIARTLTSNIREHDLAVRYGGEEFVLLLPATGDHAALEVAARLRVALEVFPWPLAPVTASFGVSTLTLTTPDGETLVEEADKALYRSKRRGRNCVTHHEHRMPITVPGTAFA